MRNLDTRNKIIFGLAFVATNALCTWLVLELGVLL